MSLDTRLREAERRGDDPDRIHLLRVQAGVPAPDFRTVLVPREIFGGPAHRMFHALLFATGARLSVQASSFHYCTPRETLGDLNRYTHWEVGYMTEQGLTAPPDDFPDRDHFEVGSSPVSGYVETATVQAMLQYLWERSAPRFL